MQIGKTYIANWVVIVVVIMLVFFGWLFCSDANAQAAPTVAAGIVPNLDGLTDGEFLAVILGGTLLILLAIAAVSGMIRVVREHR